MVLTDNLPSDSVLRRHTLTERGRVLGLPPSDAVLRRHHEQLVTAERTAAAALAARPAATAARPAMTRPVAATPVSRPPVAAANHGGGLLGWLRRLFGG